MSLALADLQTWLGGLVEGAPAIQINRLPDTPDEVVVVIFTGGSEPLYEGAFERRHISLRFRATTDAAAEALAASFHEAISASESSFQMGGSYIEAIEPQVPPMYFGRDVSQRTTYSASYVITYAT